MTDDAELLRRFAEEQSETAFAELVNRHVGLVYVVAVRRLGADRHLAEDVVQSVFVDLARKARGLSRNVVLTGWLFTSARFAASRAARTESRRRAHEQHAIRMNEILSEGGTVDWEMLRPQIDELIAKLPQRDREAVLLRFFEGRDYAEVGARLAMSPDGARTRVNRALEKLHALLTLRGIPSTTAALSGALASQPVLAVPTGLAANVTAAGMSVAWAGKGAVGVSVFMSMNKAFVAIAGALAVAGIASFVMEHQTAANLRIENERLRAESAATVSLRTENARLAAGAHELASKLDVARSEHADLLRARDEIAILTKQATAARVRPKPSASPAEPTPAGLLPTSAWTNAGMSTPAASYESAMWAHREADVDALARLITFGDAERAKVAALFAHLPEEARNKFGSPEKMIALIFATGPDHAGFQILSQTPTSESTMNSEVLVQSADGRVDHATITFLRGPAGWQMVVPADEVMSQIRKITEPSPKT